MAKSQAQGPFAFPPGYPPAPDNSLRGEYTFPPGFPSSVQNYPTSNPQVPAVNDGPPIPPTPQIPGGWNVQYLNHTTYWTQSHYRFSSGLAIMPTAGPVGSNNRCVRMRAPQMTRLVNWACTSEDDTKPSLPDPQATNYEILLDADFFFLSPELDENNVIHSWSAAGWYLYGMIAPRTITDGFLANNPATDTLGLLGTLYTGANFVQGVIGPATTPANAQPASKFPETGAEALQLT